MSESRMREICMRAAGRQRIGRAKFGNLLLYEEGAFRVAAMRDAPPVPEELGEGKR